MIKTLMLNVLLCCVQLAFSQVQPSSDMDKTLQRMQLEYLQPTEQVPQFMGNGKIKYFDYNFGLDLDGGKMQILVQTRNDDGNYIPQVAISTLVATLATNDQAYDIRMMGTTETYLLETNSDWAIESLFVPKKNMTDYKVAYLKSLFKNGVGAVNILYLSNEEIEVFPILRFLEN